MSSARWRRDANHEGGVRFALPDEFPLRLRVLRWLGHRRWIPRGQDRLLRLIHHPDTGPAYFFEVDFFGQRYRGNLAHYVDWLVFCYGGAPYCELGLLKELAGALRIQRRGPLSFFDVGANAGHHTLFMAPLVDRVVAFEPLPDLIALIDEKIALNNLSNVEVVPVAIGDTDEDRTYTLGRGANSGEGGFLHGDEPGQGDRVTLPIRHGDRVCQERNLPRVDLMKVDVEGFEPYVFRGFAGTIARDRPAILTEMSERSWRGFTSEQDFRAAFYSGACFAEVAGSFGSDFTLKPFRFASSAEVLIVPDELSGFIRQHL